MGNPPKLDAIDTSPRPGLTIVPHLETILRRFFCGARIKSAFVPHLFAAPKNLKE
jgi:hypothetical protein